MLIAYIIIAVITTTIMLLLCKMVVEEEAACRDDPPEEPTESKLSGWAIIFSIARGTAWPAVYLNQLNEADKAKKRREQVLASLAKWFGLAWD